jgi:hypothetical protein
MPLCKSHQTFDKWNRSLVTIDMFLSLNGSIGINVQAVLVVGTLTVTGLTVLSLGKKELL